MLLVKKMKQKFGEVRRAGKFQRTQYSLVSKVKSTGLRAERQKYGLQAK